MNKSLIGIIGFAYKSMEESNFHDLKLGYRRAIWSHLGPRYDSNSEQNDRTGLKKRTVLALITTRHVLHLWEKVWKNEKTLQQILNKTEQIINDNVKMSYEDACNYMNELWSWFENIEYDDNNIEHYNSLSVAAAAIKTVSTALFDENFSVDNINFESTDEEMDPYDSDSGYHAAAAYAGGTIWDENSDKQKRKEFWEWWLKEAVPRAWNMEY